MVVIPEFVFRPYIIKKGSILYFKADCFRDNQPHYFVIIGYDAVTDKLYMVNATSGVDGRKNFIARRNLPAETLVIADPTDCHFLSHESVFNCNDVTPVGFDEVYKKYSEGKLKCNCTEYTEESILNKILAGVGISPLVSPEIKEIITNT